MQYKNMKNLAALALLMGGLSTVANAQFGATLISNQSTGAFGSNLYSPSSNSFSSGYVAGNFGVGTASASPISGGYQAPNFGIGTPLLNTFGSGNTATSTDIASQVSTGAGLGNLADMFDGGEPSIEELTEDVVLPVGSFTLDRRISGSYTKSFGYNSVGGDVRLSGHVDGKAAAIYGLGYPIVDVDAYGRGQMRGRLLGMTKTLAEVNASADLRNGTYVLDGTRVMSFQESLQRGSSLRLKLANVTLKNYQDDFGQIASGNLSRPVFSSSQVFTLGVFPVRVTTRATVGSGLSMNIEARAQNHSPSLKIQGDADVYANGSASAALELLVASFGVKGSVRLVDSKISFSEGYAPSSGVSGTLRVACKPISTAIKAFVKYWAPTWSNPFRRKTRTRTIWSWSPASWSKNKVLH